MGLDGIGWDGTRIGWIGLEWDWVVLGWVGLGWHTLWWSWMVLYCAPAGRTGSDLIGLVGLDRIA